MKILFICAKYSPESFSSGIVARELQKAGHQVTVITGRPARNFALFDKRYKHLKKEVIDGVTVYRVHEHIRKPRMLSRLLNYWTLSAYIYSKVHRLKEDFDIVFSYSLSPVFLLKAGNYYAHKHHIPHLVYALDQWPESLVASSYATRRSWIYKCLFRLSKKLYREASLIAVSSESQISYFRDVLGLHDLSMRVIRQPLLQNEISYKSSSYDDQKFHLLYCGSCTTYGRLDMLLEAIAKVNDPRLILDVVGDGTTLYALKEESKRLNLNDRVQFYGRLPIDETIPFYEKCDAIYISMYDNSYTTKMIPQKLGESLNVGKPILAMIQGDGQKLLKKAGGSVLVSQTVEGIAKGLRKILAMSKEELKKCGEMNLEYFQNSQEFSLKRIMNDFEETLLDLANKKSEK